MSPSRVVVSLITEEQEFQKLQARDAREACARLGLDVEVLFAENNSILQIQQLFRFVHMPEGERPAAIVTETVSGDGLERVARNAVKAGVGWMLLNRNVPYLDALRRERPDLVISSTGTDQEKVGRIQARQFRALLPSGGTVLYIQGPNDTSVAKERLRGALDELASAPIKLRVLTGDWTEQSGEKAVAAWLRLKTSGGVKIDLVGSQNDSMAVGARRAILAAHADWSHVRYTGCDGLPDGGRRLVDEGVLAATVVTPSNAGPALERVAQWLRSGVVPPSQILLGPEPYPAIVRPRP